MESTVVEKVRKKRGGKSIKALVLVLLGFLLLVSVIIAILFFSKGSDGVAFNDMIDLKTGTKTYDFSLASSSGDNVAGKLITSYSGENMNLDLTLSRNTVSVLDLSLVEFDSVVYLDIQRLRESLVNSKDVTLMAYGESLPVNISFVTVSNSDLKFMSKLSELDEPDMFFVGLDNLLSRVGLGVKMFVSSPTTNGFVSMSEKDGVSTYKSGVDYSSFIRKSIQGIDVYYDRFNNNLISLSLASDYEVSTGFVSAKDNFIEKYSSLWKKFSLLSDSDVNAGLDGVVKVYTSDSGVKEYDSSFKFTFADGVNDYTLMFYCVTSPSEKKISKPEGSTIALSDFEKEFYKLELLSDEVLSFANLAELPLGYSRLSKSTETLNKELSDISVSYLGGVLEEEDFNRVLKDYVESATGLDLVDTSVIEAEPIEVSKYATLEGTLDTGLEYSFSVNEELSSSSLIAVNVRLLNQSDKEIDLRANKFSMRKVDGSGKYTANNEARLIELFPDFDLSLAWGSLKLGVSQFTDTTMYFVVPEQHGYLELFNGSSSLGAIVLE